MSEAALYHDDDVPVGDDLGEAESLEEQAKEEEVVEEPKEEKRVVAQDKMDLAERRKRQDVERQNEQLRERIARLEGRVESINEPKAVEEALEVDFTDVAGSIDKISKKNADKVRATLLEQLEKERAQEWQERLEDSIEDAKDQYDDFDETLREFLTMQNNDRTGKLARRVRRQQNPAEFAYKYAKKHQQKNSKVAELEKEIQRLRSIAGEETEEGPPPKKKKSRLAGVRSSSAKTTGNVLDDSSAFEDALDGR